MPAGWSGTGATAGPDEIHFVVAGETAAWPFAFASQDKKRPTHVEDRGDDLQDTGSTPVASTIFSPGSRRSLSAAPRLRPPGIFSEYAGY